MQYKFNTKVTFRLLECQGYDLNLFFYKRTSKRAYIEQKEKTEKEKKIELMSLYFLHSSIWDSGLYAFREVLERLETQ